MEFRVLGSFRVVSGRGALALGGAQQRAVLALLLIRSPEAVSADRLVDEVWGERPPASAQHAVQVYVSGIRKILRAGGDGVAVRSTPSGYVLEVQPDQVDFRRFERLLGEAQSSLAGDPLQSRSRFEAALELWRGSPLAEFEHSELARSEADRLKELHVVALEGLLEARLECGEDAELIATITGVVAANPLRERPRRLQMLALYRTGRHAEALAAYRDACAALDEIGLQPGPELRRLEEAILRHDASLAPNRSPRPFSEVRDRTRIESAGPLESSQSRLPVPAHALVGRRSEMSSVLALLARRDVRFVTLLGPGGSGKTRLGLEVAAEAATRYRDGVWFVALAPLVEPALVASEIARTLGVNEAEGEPVAATLARALERRELLLVLDNFEHLLPAAGLVSQFLAAAPRLDVLVTSREALRLNGEHRMEVPPLPLADAAELFLDRARAIRSDLGERVEDRAAVDRICLRLDRLPLALELAAARVALFGARALEARLAQRLSLPEGARDLPDRQRTLRATIDWSYQLLSPDEQTLFRGLAAFAGGARLEAIEATFPDGQLDSIEIVAALVDKSLLRRRDDPDGQPRFWMLETIREYATECLMRREADAAAARHAAYFLDFAEEGQRHFNTHEQATWLARLEADHDNLRAAFDHLVEQSPSQALRLVATLGDFWEIHGHVSEGRERLQRALACGPGEGPAAAKANFLAGRFALFQGEGDRADPLLTEALRLARRAGDMRIEVMALTHIGWVALADGQAERSVELHEQAVTIARSGTDDWALGVAVNNLGDTLMSLGHAARARPLLEEALELSCRIGEPMGTVHAMLNLADLELLSGDLDAAELLIAEGLRRGREIDYGAAIAGALAEEAFLALHRGQFEIAAARITEGAEFSDAANQTAAAPMLLAAAATLAATQNDALRAAQLWAAYDHGMVSSGIKDTCGAGRLRAEWLPKVRDAVDASAWDAAWTAGRKLLPEEALELAAAT